MSLLDKIGKALSHAYKSTAFKVGAVLLAGSISSGCVKNYFTSMTDGWQAETSFANDGSARFRGELSSSEHKGNSIGINVEGNETEVESTGNKIEEKKFSVDASIKSMRRNIIVKPLIETLERRVLTPAGVEESRTKGTFLGADLLFGRNWMIRPYIDTEKETSVAGNLDTTQSGVYFEGKFGIVRPLASLDVYDFGSMIPKALESQLGAAVELGNGKYSVGYFGSILDDGSRQVYKHILLADASLIEGGRSFLGVDGSYDGDLTTLGLHGAYSRRGGNMPQTAKKFRENIRDMQKLNILEKGLPESAVKNRIADLARALENTDATLFYVAGLKQEHNLADWVTEIKPYLMVGTSALSKGNVKDSLGFTLGNVYNIYPEDTVNNRWGIFFRLKLGRGTIGAVYENIDFESKKDENSFSVYYITPTR